MYGAYGKRAFDLLFSLLALVLLSPLFLLTAMLIKIYDPGPAIFRQIRIGRDGDAFALFKFRSMPVDTGDIPSDKLAAVGIGSIGKFIRRTNIDELPQLFNILKGDMSIVGPRPPISSQTELIELRKQNGSIKCRPGLTGLAQVKSFDGMTVKQKAEFDGDYAKYVTLFCDIKIILSTFIYLFKPPPVY
jgi:O-antigen biosynthesis protein WbqP